MKEDEEVRLGALNSAAQRVFTYFVCVPCYRTLPPFHPSNGWLAFYGKGFM